MDTNQLKSICTQVRRNIINQVADAASGHPGGSLSAVEMMVALYFTQMRVDPQNPTDPDRDRFVLSKGHAAPCYYGTLAEKGFFPKEELKNLRKIHSIPAPAAQENWEVYFNRKIDSKIKKYDECPIQYENGQAFINYINENRHLLKNRPQTYQHGDYHIGNMMLDKDGKLRIIDFNRSDYGDPWEEFNRIVWCAQKSPLFASGMVNGYFDGNVPMEFWKLTALYIARNTLGSVSWAIPFGQDEVDIMLAQAKDILRWYNNMQNPVPAWYTDNLCS